MKNEKQDQSTDAVATGDGQPVVTALVGNNADTIASVAKLYLQDGDTIADVTYGKGAFWRKVDLARYRFLPSDILTCPDAPHDFRHLPYESGSIDVVVLDPPYSHDPGRGMATNTQYRNHETTAGLDHDGIIQLYAEGMTEARRVLRKGGLLWVKTQDEIQSGKQRMAHIEIYEIATKSLQMEATDLFVMMRSSVPRVKRPQKHARKNHSYLWVFRKTR